MAKKLERPTKKLLTQPYVEDIDTLKEFYPPPIGVNMAIREIVHNHCKKLREKANRMEQTHVLDLELDITELTAGARAD